MGFCIRCSIIPATLVFSVTWPLPRPPPQARRCHGYQKSPNFKKQKDPPPQPPKNTQPALSASPLMKLIISAKKIKENSQLLVQFEKKNVFLIFLQNTPFFKTNGLVFVEKIDFFWKSRLLSLAR